MIFNRYSIYAATCMLVGGYCNLTHNQPGQTPEGFKQAHAQQHMTQTIAAPQKHAAVTADKKTSKKPCHCGKKSCWRTRQAYRSARKASSFKQFFKGFGIALGLICCAAIPVIGIAALSFELSAIALSAIGLVSFGAVSSYSWYLYKQPNGIEHIKKMALTGGLLIGIPWLTVSAVCAFSAVATGMPIAKAPLMLLAPPQLLL